MTAGQRAHAAWREALLTPDQQKHIPGWDDGLPDVVKAAWERAAAAATAQLREDLHGLVESYRAEDVEWDSSTVDDVLDEIIRWINHPMTGG